MDCVFCRGYFGLSLWHVRASYRGQRVILVILPNVANRQEKVANRNAIIFQPVIIGTMKMKKEILTTWLIRAYMLYSVTADIIVIGGIVWLILN